MDDLIRLDDDLISAPTLDRDPALVYLAGLAESGRRTMAGKLKAVARILGHDSIVTVPWHLLRYQHIVALRTQLQESGYAPATVNATLHALRGVARACFNLELIGADDLQRIRDVRPVQAHRLPAGRAITPGEIGALMDACSADCGPAGVRDAAIIGGLLIAGGLRRAEVVALDVADYDPESGELRVLGKNNKQRVVYADNGAKDALDDWLLILGETSGPLFTPINRGGRLIRQQRMSDHAVYEMLRRRSELAGVRDITPHDCRRTCISTLLGVVDISTVARFVGHQSVVTSQRYDRRGDEESRRAAGMIHIPYRRRMLPSGGDLR
jgi:integrase